jgi:hypothetical protein
VSWSHLPRHHHPPGAVYEQHYGTPDDLALDYKSVTLGELTLFGGSVHRMRSVFFRVLYRRCHLPSGLSAEKRDQVRLRSRL